jgi:hypothetical protein
MRPTAAQSFKVAIVMPGTDKPWNQAGYEELNRTKEGFV